MNGFPSAVTRDRRLASLFTRRNGVGECRFTPREALISSGFERARLQPCRKHCKIDGGFSPAARYLELAWWLEDQVFAAAAIQPRNLTVSSWLLSWRQPFSPEKPSSPEPSWPKLFSLRSSSLKLLRDGLFGRRLGWRDLFRRRFRRNRNRLCRRCRCHSLFRRSGRLGCLRHRLCWSFWCGGRRGAATPLGLRPRLAGAGAPSAPGAAAAAAFPRPRFGAGGGGGGGGSYGFRKFMISVCERSLPSSSSRNALSMICGYSGSWGVMRSSAISGNGNFSLTCRHLLKKFLSF